MFLMLHIFIMSRLLFPSPMISVVVLLHRLIIVIAHPMRVLRVVIALIDKVVLKEARLI